MKKLPIGIQSFSELRNGGYLYIDKTELIYRLATEGKYYFLSRPRRFGKSLLISTLAELFRGDQILFERLWVHDQWDWNTTYPVLDFRFNKGSYKIIGLEAFLYEELADKAVSHHIALKKSSYPAQLEELVVSLSKQYNQVVVLVDEYDKPILDYLDDIEQAKKNCEVLKNFYSVLKPLDSHLRFVLLTGVSKFSRVSIFSELNNLKDLTMHPRYTTLLGYTQEELVHYFADRIDQLAPGFGGRDALLAQIKQWYNGYTWDAEHYVYNPFSILNFFDQERFRNFWFETGTPTFLVKLLERQRQYNLEQIRVDEAVFSTFDIERINPNALLFQAGYTTIASADEAPTYILSYPNQEVRDSLLRYLLAEFTHSFASDVPVMAQQMKQSLQQQDVAGFVQALNSLFASIPYQIFIADKEAYYHSVTFLALSLTGTFIQVEVSQAKGRPDAVVYTDDIIYVLEFKLDESAEVALEQIKERGYTDAYQGQRKTIKAVGFSFSSQQKAVDQWQEETVRNDASTA